MIEQLNLTVFAGQDGGLVIYELIDGEQVLVFGGDLEAFSKYMNARGSKIIVTTDRPAKEPPRQIARREAPVSANLRRLEELEAAE